jgi:hypothetical protein
MAVSAVVSWAASRSMAVIVAGADLGGAVLGTVGVGGTVVVIVVVMGGGLTVDRPSPEQAANNRPTAKRPTSRWRER